MRYRLLPLTMLLLSSILRAAESTPAIEAAPVQAPPDELSEIIVQAPEPRFVAPTRRDRIGRVWVPVLINDKGPFRLVLDSGATRSAVIARVATQLGLRMDVTPPVMLRGVTGSAVVPTIGVDSLLVGDLYVGHSILPIVNDAFGGAEGLLGNEGMQDKRIYIDFRNDFINVSRSKNRRADNGFQEVPFIKDEFKLLMVRAAVGNTPVRAIIDTGAQATIGNEALKFALTRQLARRKKSNDEITGATGDMQEGVGAQVSPISLGDISIQNVHVTFGDMKIFELWNITDEPALLIGMDVLGLLDTLVIDYKRREIHIKPMGSDKTPLHITTGSGAFR
jgi:predicted aspartyl protease